MEGLDRAGGSIDWPGFGFDPVPAAPPRRAAVPGRPDWDALPAPHPLLRAVVIVPAKDEAALLPRCLAALAGQRAADGSALDPRGFEVIVLANNCRDDTAAVARRFAAAQRQAAHGPGCAVHVAEATLPPEVAHIGQARRLLMDQACQRLHAARRRAGGAADASARGVVLSTDGDSFVAADWIDRTLAEIDAGADAVGGRILAEAAPSGDRAVQRWQRLDAIHRLLCIRLACLIDPDPADPWPRHHQHFGASLAVAVDAYEQVGGLPAVRFLEDEALHERLVRAGLRVRHSPRVRAYTSCRHDGRVEVGLSWQLRTWARTVAGEEAGLRVAPPAEVAALAGARARLRRLWLDRGHAPAGGPRGLAGVARALRVPARWLRTVLHEAGSFGALWIEVERQRGACRLHDATPRVPVEQAIAELKHLVAGRLAVDGGDAARPCAGARAADAPRVAATRHGGAAAAQAQAPAE